MSAHEDIKEMQAERDALEDDALLRTRRALFTIKNTEGVAQDTLSTLQSQGEQLSTTETKAREMDANAQVNYRDAKKVKKHGHLFGFSFTTFFNRKKKNVDNQYLNAMADIEKESEKDKLKQRQHIVDTQQREEIRTKRKNDKKESPGPSLAREKTEKELEIDRNLGEISQVTKNLSTMAQEMSQELDEHKTNISKIRTINEHAQKTLERSEKKIEKYS